MADAFALLFQYMMTFNLGEYTTLNKSQLNETTKMTEMTEK